MDYRHHLQILGYMVDSLEGDMTSKQAKALIFKLQGYMDSLTQSGLYLEEGFQDEKTLQDEKKSESS